MHEPNAELPTAVLLLEVVLESKAKAPTATFEAPVVFNFKESLPIAVLLFAVVFEYKAFPHTATLLAPVVVENKD